MLTKMKFSKKIDIELYRLFNKRTYLRHRLNHETDRDKTCVRHAYYDPDHKCIIRVDAEDPTKGYCYTTPTAFCTEHYVLRRKDRVSNCNGWKELEAFINGKWVSLMALRSDVLQSTKSMA